MCDQWMPLIELPLTIEQFRQMPRNPAYKYEYLGGKAYLSPRARHYHAVLDLQRLPVSEEVEIRQIRSEELEELIPLFCEAFRSIQPYGSLDDETMDKASRHSLERTRTGGDGPLIEQASFIALDKDKRPGTKIGAILITLLPEGDETDADSYYWRDPPPADCLERRQGRPHLTWIFVSPLEMGQGIGTALLAAASNALLDMGFTQLLTTFISGNDSSMLWHWRNGFRLLAYPGSRRAMKERWKSRGVSGE
jgi:GNAT superfamily N-acetyltransferase